jgi:hypothetical protein
MLVIPARSPQLRPGLNGISYGEAHVDQEMIESINEKHQTLSQKNKSVALAELFFIYYVNSTALDDTVYQRKKWPFFYS